MHQPGFRFPKLSVVTGTDTGVGKTVLTAALTMHLRRSGIDAVALKPYCSGGRDDARLLRRITGGRMSLDDLNPWHYRAPLAPRIAAQRQGARPSLTAAERHICAVARIFPCVIVEGAGGLLSPLAVDGDARELIQGLNAVPLVVGPNRLGAINQIRLVLQALPSKAARVAQIILMRQVRPDHSAKSNLRFLQDLFGAHRVVELPRLTKDEIAGRSPFRPAIRRVLDQLTGRGD